MFFQKLYRATRVVLTFLFGMAELVIKRPRTRPDRALWLSNFCKKLLRNGDITYTVVGSIPTHGAVISNHLNYTDILMHSAMRPCVFVSKAELRRTPVLGWVSMMSGTIYVERGAGGSAAKAAAGMAKDFRDGLPVVYFPEGGTTDGLTPAAPFHSGLLAQTLLAGQPITAAFIHYDLSPADLAAGHTATRDIHWSTQPLLKHLWAQTGIRALRGTVYFAEAPIPFSAGALADRKVAAEEARAAVLALSVPLQQAH
jgi:1-acyl-sn-glycerol-3-phosphate acyltransferase